MTTRIGPVAACMPLASPDKRRRVTIPPLDRIAKPIFEDLHIINMMPFHRSANENPLHRFSHVQPGASTWRVQAANAAFMTPTHKIVAVMARQIVQNEQHAQGGIHPIQLLDRWKRVPLLPAPPCWRLLWSG